MLDWLTVLELTAAVLVALVILSVIAYLVNQARAKAGAADSGKTRTVAEPSRVATTPEPRNATSPAANVTSPAAVVTRPAAEDFPPPSASLLPPVEPVPRPLPVVEAIPPANKIVSERFPRFVKPPAVPAARRKNAIRLKTTRSSKIKRPPKRANARNERPISFTPVAKAKPVLTRRPKRVTQIRRKKITAPVRRVGKAVANRSPRPVLTSG